MHLSGLQLYTNYFGSKEVDKPHLIRGAACKLVYDVIQNCNHYFRGGGGKGTWSIRVRCYFPLRT